MNDQFKLVFQGKHSAIESCGYKTMPILYTQWCRPAPTKLWRNWSTIVPGYLAENGLGAGHSF
jgi:hypothetical protein